jgi:hypothetical protein
MIPTARSVLLGLLVIELATRCEAERLGWQTYSEAPLGWAFTNAAQAGGHSLAALPQCRRHQSRGALEVAPES